MNYHILVTYFACFKDMIENTSETCQTLTLHARWRRFSSMKCRWQFQPAAMYSMGSGIISTVRSPTTTQKCTVMPVNIIADGVHAIYQNIIHQIKIWQLTEGTSSLHACCLDK